MNAEQQLTDRLRRALQSDESNIIHLPTITRPAQPQPREPETIAEPIIPWIAVQSLAGTPAHGIRELNSPLSD